MDDLNVTRLSKWESCLQHKALFSPVKTMPISDRSGWNRKVTQDQCRTFRAWIGLVLQSARQLFVENDSSEKWKVGNVARIVT